MNLAKPVNLPVFWTANNLHPFISNELQNSVTLIPFRGPRGKVSHGYHATLLPEVCNVYLESRKADALWPNQRHIAERCELLVCGLATVGIIALVDEATGYQQIREQRALATILEQFIAKDLQPWTKTFPYEFYEQIFRLKGWPSPTGRGRSPLIGLYTNNVVYERIAPGVLAELKQRNPTLPTGRRKHTHHQWFTPDLGHPKLKEHLAAVIALMRISMDWADFQHKLDRAFPKLNKTIPLPLDIT